MILKVRTFSVGGTVFYWCTEDGLPIVWIATLNGQDEALPTCGWRRITSEKPASPSTRRRSRKSLKYAILHGFIAVEFR